VLRDDFLKDMDLVDYMRQFKGLYCRMGVVYGDTLNRWAIYALDLAGYLIGEAQIFEDGMGNLIGEARLKVDLKNGLL